MKDELCCRVFVPLKQHPNNRVALNLHLKLQLEYINMF